MSRELRKAIKDLTCYLRSCHRFGKRDFYQQNYSFYRREIYKLMVKPEGK